MLLMTSLFLIGCGESEDELLVEEPVVEEPVIEPIVESNFCKVGDVLQPGESCIDGTGEVFTVLENGQGQYLNVTAGGISIFANVNGKETTFSAQKKADGSWEIKAVSPKQ